MARNDTTKHIDGLVPWQKVATFLNEMAHSSNIDFSVIECDEFLNMGGMFEDVLIDGHTWSKGYLPRNFSKKAMVTGDGHSIEVQNRTYRCLWLGRRLSKVCFISSLYGRQFLTNLQYFEYRSQRFSLTPLAEEHGKAVCFDIFVTTRLSS